jgi:hypothetical protein
MGTFEEVADVYRIIRSTKYTFLSNDLVDAAVRYARIRTDWMLSSPEQRRELDDNRSRAHTAFIECCDVLSRNMAEVGEDNSWRDQIGGDRKTLGDFACHLHCLLGVMAR